MRLAFTTFAILRRPYGDPEVQEFDDRTPYVFAAAQMHRGFVARAVEVDDAGASNFERDWGLWGEFQVPRFYTLGRTSGTDQRASTLSIWTDIQSVFEFVYSGLHLGALKKREQWFQKPAWPSYACWWVADDAIPTWADASARLEHLHDHGPTPYAFNFHTCFDESGQAVSVSAMRETGRPAHSHL